jgi:hypothetical protein
MAHSKSANGATKIMVIRHAEKPGTYGSEKYSGVNLTATSCGKTAEEDLVTLGWQRAGALVSLFAKPWGPKPGLATPQFLYAADPDSKTKDSAAAAKKTDDEPSQRPFETITPLASTLGLTINKKFSKKHYPAMIDDALQCQGIVLICWQHQDIPLENGAKQPGLSQVILTQTGTTGTFQIPQTWPTTPAGVARYDLVFVFDRPAGSGPITAFSMVPQLLLAGDLPWKSST